MFNRKHHDHLIDYVEHLTGWKEKVFYGALLVFTFALLVSEKILIAKGIITPLT